jgi:DNA-binding response OmpR family regulator
LLIEDEPKIARAIARGLKQERFVVEVCDDGEDGLNIALVETYDVMIFDRMLPGMEGLEICRRLREAGCKTPILILTAKGQVNDRVEGLMAGADDYLVKPFSFAELLARVRALLRRPAGMCGDVLTAGEVTLDTVNRVVWRSEAKVELTNTEFKLLEYLLRQVGRVVGKEEIISHVWGFETDILPNTVEAHVGALRRKLGGELIETVRGVGYVVRGER